jgi:hypothetical protein
MARPIKPRVSELSPPPPTTLIPYRSKDTSARADYTDGSIYGPVSVRGHFSRRAPTEIPACWLKRSPSEGRSSGGGEWGGGVTSPLSSPSSYSSSSPPEDSCSEGVSSPRALAVGRAVLQAHLLCLHTRNHSMWVRLASRLAASSGKVTPPPPARHCVHARDPAHEHACVEKQKLVQVDESEFKWTHPGVVDPFS